MCDLDGISEVIVKTINDNAGLSDFQKEELINDLGTNLTDFIKEQEKKVEVINEEFSEAFSEQKEDELTR